MAAQLMATSGRWRRGELSCTAWANSSLPTPDSPHSSSGMDLPTTRRALSAARRQAVSPVSSCCRASAGAGVAAAGAGLGRVFWRRGACTWAKIGSPLRRCSATGSWGRCWLRASRASSRVSSTRVMGVAPMSLVARPSSSRAWRLAPMLQPSSDSATMPSARVPMPSGWRCRCSRTRCGLWEASSRFSIMRAAVFTRPRVCGWWLRWSPEMSRMPSSSPVADRMGAAAQVRKSLRAM